MKKIKIPSLLAYIQGIVMLLIASVAFAIVFNLGDFEAAKSVAPKIFTVAFTLMTIFGILRVRIHAKGSLFLDALVINDTTYAGTFAPYFILPALFGMDTYNKGAVYFKDGIKKKHTIGKIDFSQPLQTRIATPVASGGDITIDGNVLNPQDIMVYQEFNPRDLESHWTSEDLAATLLTRQLPPTVENYVTLLIVGRAFEQFENLVWMGSTTYTAAAGSTGNGQLVFFDGFMKKFVADAGVYKTSSPVALTATNIGNALLDLYQGCAINNKALLASSARYTRMKFLVSINTSLIYEDFLTTQPFKNNNTTEKGIMQYKGYEIVPLAGMPDDTIIFTEAVAQTDGNLWLGMNSILDENFQLARLYANSELFFFKMLMKMDVNYGFANKVFMYTTAVAGTFTA